MVYKVSCRSARATEKSSVLKNNNSPQTNKKEVNLDSVLKVPYLINPIRAHERLLGTLPSVQGSTHMKRRPWFLFYPFEVWAVEVS